MSVDVFLQAFQDGEPQDVSTQDILSCVAAYAQERSDSFVELVFGPIDSCTLYLNTLTPTVQGLTVNRPCSDPRLAHVLFSIMQLGNFVLFVPGEEHPIVLHPSTNAHLPDEFTEALGDPIVAGDVNQFTEAFMSGG